MRGASRACVVEAEVHLSAGITAFVAFALVFLFVVGRRIRRSRIVLPDSRWLPRELRNAELVYAERTFKTTDPIPIVARVDRAYRKSDGVIVLVDLKTRRGNRPFLSDIIELSAQRLAVQGQTGETIADYGYVLTQRVKSRTKKPQRAKLLSIEEVIRLAKRRRAILARVAVPERARVERLCPQCAFERECRGEVFRRKK